VRERKKKQGEPKFVAQKMHTSAAKASTVPRGRVHLDDTVLFPAALGARNHAGIGRSQRGHAETNTALRNTASFGVGKTTGTYQYKMRNKNKIANKKH
jgi:hypothetical protein